MAVFNVMVNWLKKMRLHEMGWYHYTAKSANQIYWKEIQSIVSSNLSIRNIHCILYTLPSKDMEWYRIKEENTRTHWSEKIKRWHIFQHIHCKLFREFIILKPNMVQHKKMRMKGDLGRKLDLKFFKKYANLSHESNGIFIFPFRLKLSIYNTRYKFGVEIVFPHEISGRQSYIWIQCGSL